jgi:hypothetical protein
MTTDPFINKVLEFLHNETVGKSRLRVQVDKIELGQGQFRIRFRLAQDDPIWDLKSIEISSNPIGVTDNLYDHFYFFTFKRYWGVSGSMKKFRDTYRGI